jgi:hypothetical protein
MRRLLPLHLGLVAGCLAGLAVHDTLVQPPMPLTARQWKADGAMLQRRGTIEPRPLTPRLRLVDAGRTRMRIPEADYKTMCLERVDFRGADLSEADFGQSWIRGCDFRGAEMEHADPTDATYDAATRWPAGFDPVEHGALRG